MTENPETISLIFEEDTPTERIAEFIQLLSEVYGGDLDIVSVNDIPPLPKLRDVS